MNLSPPQEPAAERLERLLGRLLSLGVTLSAALLAAGLALWLGSGGNQLSHVVLDLGLIVLMGTPMLRVAVSFVEDLRERDWLFVATTLAVLLVLAGTLMVAAVAAR